MNHPSAPFSFPPAGKHPDSPPVPVPPPREAAHAGCLVLSCDRTEGPGPWPPLSPKGWDSHLSCPFLEDPGLSPRPRPLPPLPPPSLLRAPSQRGRRRSCIKILHVNESWNIHIHLLLDLNLS